MNKEICMGCRYRAYEFDVGWHCAYLLITGKSRIGQMTPEQRERGECPVKAPGLPLKIPKVRPRMAKAAYKPPKLSVRTLGATPGQALRNYRINMGLTQIMLGKLMGISGQAVSEWERDRVPINHGLLSRVFPELSKNLMGGGETDDPEGVEMQILRQADPVDPDRAGPDAHRGGVDPIQAAD